MPATREEIDLITRGELENMMALEGLPHTCLTCVFGYDVKYVYILKLILRAMNCTKLIASKKDIQLDIRAFIEMPKNYEESELYIKWKNYKKNNLGFSNNFHIDELRNYYSKMPECRNYYIENVINRGDSIDFYKEWKGILAKCATQHPDSKNPFRITEAKNPLNLAVKPFQVLRGSRLIKVEELTDFKDAKVNGRLEMVNYMYISGIDNIILFLKGSLS